MSRKILELYKLKDSQYVMQAEIDITGWTVGQVTELMRLQAMINRVGRIVKINQSYNPPRTEKEIQ